MYVPRDTSVVMRQLKNVLRMRGVMNALEALKGHAERVERLQLQR